jgi:uncharacterized YigZ family protein
MTQPTPRYPIPAARHRVEEEILRSRFVTTLAYAPTVEEARAFIDEVRVEFDDASHNCWAYVVGQPGSTAQNGMSDDGEPHGTAGRPMLTVLLHSGVGDIAAVVTRYFGGTLLGKGGLVRAYSGGVQYALESLPTAEKVEKSHLTVLQRHHRGTADAARLRDRSAGRELWGGCELSVADARGAGGALPGGYGRPDEWAGDCGGRE